MSSFEIHYKRIREHIDHILNSGGIDKTHLNSFVQISNVFGRFYDDNSYQINRRWRKYGSNVGNS